MFKILNLPKKLCKCGARRAILEVISQRELYYYIAMICEGCWSWIFKEKTVRPFNAYGSEDEILEALGLKKKGISQEEKNKRKSNRDEIKKVKEEVKNLPLRKEPLYDTEVFPEIKTFTNFSSFISPSQPVTVTKPRFEVPKPIKKPILASQPMPKSPEEEQERRIRL